MLNRNVSLVVCLGVLASTLLAQNLGNTYVVEFGNSNAASGQFQGFSTNGAAVVGTPSFQNSGPAGANQIIPKPDGSKFYVAGPNGIDDFTPAFGTPATINGLPCVSQAKITPDGRYLLVVCNASSGASNLYVLNASTTSVNPDAIVYTQAISGAVKGIAISRDAQTAWILGELSQTFIVTVNLATLTQVGNQVPLVDPVSDDALGGGATGLYLSPLGKLYVTAADAIIEINPATLQQTTPSFLLNQVVATPGPLKFSSDGTMAYFVNTLPTGVEGGTGQSILSIALPLVAGGTQKAVWPPFAQNETLPVFDSLVIASPTRLFGHTSATSPQQPNTLWDIASDFSSVVPASLTGVTATSVLSFVLSNELPSAQYLYALVGQGSQASIYQVNLTTNASISEIDAQLGTGTLQLAVVPEESNPTSFLQYNATQLNLAAGATAAPLIARVLDPQGRPVYAVPVTFTGDSSLTITGASTATNADGYAQATVKVGQTPGSYPVTLTAGTGSTVATTTFALAIAGGTGTGPTGGGPNQMSIVSGNGGLFNVVNASGSCADPALPPLIIKLVDTNGNPLPNQPVTFTALPSTTSTGQVVQAGIVYGGTVDPETSATDGTACTTFRGDQLPQNTPFLGVQVTSQATQGAVTFQETVYQIDPVTETGPSVNAIAPQTTINLGEGDTLPAAITATVFSSGTPIMPIPNIAINILDLPISASSPSTTSGPAYCQGNPLSDANGNINCNLVAVCTTSIQPATGLPWGPGLHSFVIDFGQGYVQKTGYTINIVTPGSTRALTIAAGNNQSGRPGTTIPLTVSVTDQCGVIASGATVTWKVVQGSATLSATTSNSNQNGSASTTLTLGQIAGTVQVVASIGTSTLATFTETVQPIVGTIKLVSGGGQNVLTNQAFPNPVVFQVTDTNNNPIAGLTVTFALVGGSASFGGVSSLTTNAQGEVSLTVTAGNTAGPVTIDASYGTLSASATLTVTGIGPTVTATSFVNAASGQAGLTPCGLTVVTGNGLATNVSGVILGSNITGVGLWPYTLNGVTITVNGTPVPIEAVSNQNGNQQVNFQTPCEIVTGSPATVVVTVGSTSTTVTNVTVYPAQPGIFTYAGPNGVNYAYIIDSNGNPLTPSNLATAGNTYYLIATGLGQTNPVATTNAVGTGSQVIPVSEITLSIANIGVPVLYAQYQQGERGQYVIAFTIPVPFQTGTNQPITLGVTINQQTFNSQGQAALPGIH